MILQDFKIDLQNQGKNNAKTKENGFKMQVLLDISALRDKMSKDDNCISGGDFNETIS